MLGNQKKVKFAFFAALLTASFVTVTWATSDLRVPALSALLKPEIYRRVLKEREIAVYANLSGKKYSVYTSFLVRNKLEQVRQAITDHRLYPKLIHYIEKAEYDPSTKILQLHGSIWSYKLFSKIQFDEKSDRWIHFKVLQGHFEGLSGDLFFEPVAASGLGSGSSGGTLVYARGEVVSEHWPPAVVVERGAEVFFNFGATRMRTYLETQGVQFEAKFESQKKSSAIEFKGSKEHDAENESIEKEQKESPKTGKESGKEVSKFKTETDNQAAQHQEKSEYKPPAEAGSESQEKPSTEVPEPRKRFKF